MTCDQTRENIPGLVRRELSGYERIPVLNHLQHCPDCQSEYKQYLKIFYSIDLEAVSKPIFTVPIDSLVTSVQLQDITSRVLHLFRKRTFYTAAAIIILGISLISYFFKIRMPNKDSPSYSIESVEINNSKTGSALLNLDSQIDAMLTENKISLTFIENQLLLLQKKGVEYFRLHQFTLPMALSEAELFAPIYNKSVPVDNCLKKVQTVKKYKSYLTISELVSFLNILEKQGA